MRAPAIGVALALVGAAVTAQDLGELARQEEKRRQEKRAPATPPKSYTNDDLRKPDEAASPAPPKAGAARKQAATPAPPPPPEPPPPAPVDTRSTAEQLDEGSWRERAAQRRAAVKGLEEQVKELDAEAGRLLWQSLQSTDTNEIMALRAQQQEVLTSLEAARKALVEAKAAVEALEAEAARAGAPLGWVREP
jgi:hypothetical protein